jgi:protein TonB
MPGLHRVKVSLDGHIPAEVQLVLSAGPPVPLHFELQPQPTPTPVRRASARRSTPARSTPGDAPKAASTPKGATAPPPPPVSLPPGVFPRRIEGSLPVYPKDARKLHLEGSVTVDMVIDEEGQPTQVRVRESAGPILDAAVLDALKLWRYEPTLREGRPVRVLHRYRHHFRAS